MCMVSIGHVLSTCLHTCDIGALRGTYGGDPVPSCMSTCRYSCICNSFRRQVRYPPYGLWEHVLAHVCACMDRAMMMRMLWVMMGMYVPFVAPSLTMKRCPCVTSVNRNIVRIALTHTHM